jgi:hypothetical protein
MVRFVEEGKGVWVVYEGEKWVMKFYDQKGYEWGKRFIEAWYGVCV